MISALLIVLALIPASNIALNLFVLRAPPRPRGRPSVAILIPARDEAERIGACLDAALASEGVDFEVIVLDDHSSDATAEIVRARAARDPRLRLAEAPPLPPGWKGKTHACHVLASLPEKPLLLFIDADVKLAPDAAARLAPGPGVALVSGVPRQITPGWLQGALAPMINFLIFGYLPGVLMRRFPTWGAAAVACGQIMMIRADAYAATGGHAAVADTLHEGLKLARHFRARGYATDFVQAAELADCRMYETARETWNGFSKNATEGMATPRALPVWTLLLGGGVLAPLLALVLAPTKGLALAVLALGAARAAQARVCREPGWTLALFPLGILLTLAVQWRALFNRRRGREVAWRGRAYRPLSG